MARRSVFPPALIAAIFLTLNLGAADALPGMVSKNPLAAASQPIEHVWQQARLAWARLAWARLAWARLALLVMCNPRLWSA